MNSYSLKIDILQKDCLSQKQNQFLQDWFSSEFGHTNLEWSIPEIYAFVEIENEIICRVGILIRKIYVNNDAINIAGISGVITKTEMRGHHFASKVLQQTESYIKNQLKLDFALLLCREEVSEFYLKLGWRIVNEATSFKQSSGEYVYSKLTMVLPVSALEWPKGPINLNGLPW